MEEQRTTYQQYYPKKKVIRCGPIVVAGEAASSVFKSIENCYPEIWEGIYGQVSLLDALIFRRISKRHFNFYERLLDRCFGNVITDLQIILRNTPGVEVEKYGGKHYLRCRLQPIRVRWASGKSVTINVDENYSIDYQRSMDPTWQQKVEVIFSRRDAVHNKFEIEHMLEL